MRASHLRPASHHKIFALQQHQVWLFIADGATPSLIPFRTHIMNNIDDNNSTKYAAAPAMIFASLGIASIALARFNPNDLYT